MAERTFVNFSSTRSRRKPVSLTHLPFDLPLALTVITLLVFGLVMMYSASWDYSLAVYDDPGYMFGRQVLWLGVGLAAGFVASVFKYTYWEKLALPLMGVTIVALLSVLMFGEKYNGAIRTLFGGSVQPSELAKLVTVIYLAVWLYARRDQLNQWGFGLAPLIGILGIVGGLIVLQPDLSAAGTVILLGGMLFFLAGGDLRQIALLVGGVLLIGWLVVSVSATGSARVQMYMVGLQNPLESSYHMQRALEAVIQGGWWGVGIGRSETKLTGLPVAPTDSIFAVIIEELGLFGGMVIVVLYGLLLWRALKIAQRAPDVLGRLLAVGCGLWLTLEAFINMGVMLHLLPFAGNALPFVSAGGSNLVVSLTAIGILMNISAAGVQESKRDKTPAAFQQVINWRTALQTGAVRRAAQPRPQPSPTTPRRKRHAIFDLRWWHRRRRVPRSGSRPSNS